MYSVSLFTDWFKIIGKLIISRVVVLIQFNSAFFFNKLKNIIQILPYANIYIHLVLIIKKRIPFKTFDIFLYE